MIAREEKVPSYKLTMVQYGLLVIFIVLGYGFWRLQVGSSDKYENLAEQNRVRTVPILAPRGKILDRYGRIIVDNYPSFSVLLLRDQKRDLAADAPLISVGLGITADDIRQRVRKAVASGAPNSQPIVLKDDITPNELAFIEAHKIELPELETIMVHRRLYPKNGFLAHLIGYVGEVSEDMLNQPQYELYEPGMIVGKSGVEKSYNDMLMGKDGQRRIEVDSKGREIRRLSDTPAIPGKPLKLSIDLDVQIAAERAIADKNGAIVAMDPHTGEILAMLSRPTFDPNAFAVRVTRTEWNRLLNDPGKPLLNKAIQAQLAPGSTFKILESVAGLQEGIAQTLVVHCAGGATFYGSYRHCHKKEGHGTVELTKGIQQSCDVFFYTLGDRLGIARLAKYADEFGLGHKTNIDLGDEASGVMPSEEWKIKNYKQKWFAGETISVAIGQGAITVTPLQLTRAIAGVSTGGTMQRPHVAMIQDLPSDYKQIALSNQAPAHIQIDPQNWERVTDAMALVPSPGGTAASAHIENVDFAGKTGSAQTMSNALAQKLGHSHSVNDNAWFCGFTPRRDPDIVVCVLFEGGEHGQFAARIAAQVVKAFVDKQRSKAIELKKASMPGYMPAPGPVQDKYSPPRQPVQPQERGEKKTAAGDVARNVRPSSVHKSAPIDFTGMWQQADADSESADGTVLRSQRFRIQSKPANTQTARAAPGLD
jgi:penicillin-binding protein 2